MMPVALALVLCAPLLFAVVALCCVYIYFKDEEKDSLRKAKATCEILNNARLRDAICNNCAFFEPEWVPVRVRTGPFWSMWYAGHEEAE